MPSVLYHCNYGGFNFTHDFIHELFRRHPGDVNLFGSGIEYQYDDSPDWVSVCEGFSHKLNTQLYRDENTHRVWYIPTTVHPSHEMRSDPRVIDLFEEDTIPQMYIAVEDIPEGCTWHIEEYDGLEEVHWSLPIDRMMDDMRSLQQNPNYIGHPLTEEWLASGMPFLEFRKKYESHV